MNVCTLQRITFSDEGTFGILSCGDKKWFSLELPWKNNQRRVSCIPEGEYKCIVRRSPKFGLTYWLTNTKERSFVLIHSGNYAGDKAKGYKSHVEGCILLGKKVGVLAGQKAILISRPAIREFMSYMENKPFTLVVKNA